MCDNYNIIEREREREGVKRENKYYGHYDICRIFLFLFVLLCEVVLLDHAQYFLCLM